MIPENRFSSVPVTGTLVSPMSLNRLVGYAMGPIAVQDPSAGLLYKIWTITAIDESVYLSAEDVPSTLIFTRPSKVHNVSLAFDPNGNVQVAFQESSISYLYWFDPVPQAYVFFVIPSATYPYITLDDARPFNSANVDIILGYISGNSIKYRQLRDRYLIEYDPTVGPGGPTVSTNILYYIGMNNRLRLEFVYGDVPIFYDTPDIMKKEILIQKSPVETLDITFDFYHTMMFNDTITTAAVVVTVDTGTDANPSAMLVGDPITTDRTVTQAITGGAVGNIYRISMSARTVNECVYVVEGLLAINNSPAVVPPETP